MAEPGVTGMCGWLRPYLPQPVWVLLRRCWSYARRLGYWMLVVLQVRGERMPDTARLWLSALAAPVTALPRLDEWRNPRLLFDARVRVAGADRFLCRRGTDDLWHVLPAAQGAVRRALTGRLRAGAVFVDAGANIGAFTLPAARIVGRGGQVVSIEMMPDTARRLREHLAMAGADNVRVIEAALSDESGREVVAREPAGRFGQASIVRRDFGPGAHREIRVRTMTLDDATADLPRIDLMKVDIEGAEALAFAGGQAALARTRCVIFEDWGGRGDGKAAALVKAAGFRLARLDGANMIGVREAGHQEPADRA